MVRNYELNKLATKNTGSIYRKIWWKKISRIKQKESNVFLKRYRNNQDEEM